MFYPARAPKGRRAGAKFDELAYYAEHFDTVEVNSSFYRPPAAATARGWAERTPAEFAFSLKLYQKFTHPDMFYKATGKDPADVGPADVDEFRAGIEPIAASGKLGALLAQFPTSFRSAPETRDYLAWLLERFKAYPVAVELRHRSWSDEGKTTLDLLGGFGAAWTQIDEPKFRVSVRQDYSPNTRGFYYMRLHGRNAEKWWTHEKSEDRYDYLYSADELKPLAEAARAAARSVKKAYLYANNHFSAKAVASAAILKHQLGQPLSGEYPQELISRYPELEGIVPTARAPLSPTSS
ncbi:MAG: DUF72 domain-containing protein [Acidobacteria bacterium]|nr:DUF72 domain-containing protein [Acidobacteriota bacterium]